MSELTGLAASTLVFVFGTLKKGYGNGQRLLSKAEFLGGAISTEGNYVMQDVGFPTLWQDQGKEPNSLKGCVVGEIYRVTPKQLASCDRLEANGRMYTREQREFLIKDETEKTTAWIYLWNLDRTNPPIGPVDGVLIWDREGRRKMRRAE